MSKVPHWKKAEVPRAKIVDYLLSRTHRDGRFKAEFFLRSGFSQEVWEVLAQAFLTHVAKYDVAKTEETPFGNRYSVEGIMESPSGKRALMRSIWFIDEGGEIPRLVTAYPIHRRKRV